MTFALLLLAGGVAAQDAASEEDWRFTALGPACGIDFRHTFGRDRLGSILEDTGAGVALFDFDGDGLLDVYLVDSGQLPGLHAPDGEARPSESRLYRNLGELRFEDVTARAGLAGGGYGMGAAVGDYDGDGDPDLYLLNYGPNVFYRNEGDGTFVDVTLALGLAGPSSSAGAPPWSVSGQFLDFDADGDLDLLVANYLAFDPASPPRPAPGEPYAGPEAYRPQASVLYRNDGERFVDVSAEAGLTRYATKSMGVTVADLDGDGALELFEAADLVPNAFFRVRAGERWREEAARCALALDAGGSPTAAMHGTVGDCDGDGRLDLFVSDLDHGCLYQNLGGLRFEEVSARSGVAGALRGLDGWAAELADLDHDGDVDLFVVNGGVFDLRDVQPPKLLANDGAGRFRDVSETLGPDFAVPMVGRGAACGDLDGDGDLDLVVSRKDQGGRARVLRNDLPPGRHWLLVALEGTRSCRDAVGARVELTASGRTQVRVVGRSRSYLSQSDPRVHFGLGDAARVERLRIHWPSGHVQELEVPGVDRVLEVREPAD